MYLGDNINYIKYDKKYDIEPIKKRLFELDDDTWTPTQRGEKWNIETKGIEVIGHKPNKAETFHISQVVYRDIDEQLKSLTIPIVKDLEKDFDCTVIRAVYVNLLKGCSIHPHIDAGKYAALAHRMHVTILINDQVIYTVGGEKYCMTELGGLYEIDNQKTHAVDNLGSEDRIHLVLLVLPNKDIDFS